MSATTGFHVRDDGFHVRDGGWMCALLTHDAPVTVSPGKALKLRYGVYVHGGLPATEKIDRQWRYFAQLQLPPALGPPVTAKDCWHGDWRRYNTPRSFQSQRECESHVKR